MEMPEIHSKPNFLSKKRKISKRLYSKMFCYTDMNIEVMTMAISWLHNTTLNVGMLLVAQNINVYQNGIKFTEQKKREEKKNYRKLRCLQNLITYRNLIIWVQSMSNTKAAPFLCHTFWLTNTKGCQQNPPIQFKWFVYICMRALSFKFYAIQHSKNSLSSFFFISKAVHLIFFIEICF